MEKNSRKNYYVSSPLAKTTLLSPNSLELNYLRSHDRLFSYLTVALQVMSGQFNLSLNC